MTTSSYPNLDTILISIARLEHSEMVQFSSPCGRQVAVQRLDDCLFVQVEGDVSPLSRSLETAEEIFKTLYANITHHHDIEEIRQFAEEYDDKEFSTIVGHLADGLRLIGQYDAPGDYAAEIIDDIAEVPEWLAGYIDYQALARDMKLGGDIIIEPLSEYGECLIFDCNP